MDKTEKIVSAIPSAAELEQLAELHKAMGDHTRMRILWHLTQKEYCVSDLAKEIGVTESALSHQLRALRIVRLVRSRKEGKKVIYSGFIENLVVFYLENSGHKITLYTKRWFALANHFFLCYNIFRYFSIFGGFLLTLNQYLL